MSATLCSVHVRQPNLTGLAARRRPGASRAAFTQLQTGLSRHWQRPRQWGGGPIKAVRGDLNRRQRLRHHDRLLRLRKAASPAPACQLSRAELDTNVARSVLNRPTAAADNHAVACMPSQLGPAAHSSWNLICPLISLPPGTPCRLPRHPSCQPASKACRMGSRTTLPSPLMTS